jgi:hypothetical protein
MHFFTILSIFLIFSLQLSSFVLGVKNNAIGSGQRLKQTSTSNPLIDGGYVFGKRDHKEKDQKGHSEITSTQVKTEVTTQESVSSPSLLCPYCGLKKRDLKNIIFRK